MNDTLEITDLHLNHRLVRRNTPTSQLNVYVQAGLGHGSEIDRCGDVLQARPQEGIIVDMVPVGGFGRRAVEVGDMTLQEQHALAHSTQLLPPLLPGFGLHGTAPWRRCPA